MTRLGYLLTIPMSTIAEIMPVRVDEAVALSLKPSSTFTLMGSAGADASDDG